MFCSEVVYHRGHEKLSILETSNLMQNLWYFEVFSSSATEVAAIQP